MELLDLDTVTLATAVAAASVTDVASQAPADSEVVPPSVDLVAADVASATVVSAVVLLGAAAASVDVASADVPLGAASADVALTDVASAALLG